MLLSRAARLFKNIIVTKAAPRKTLLNVVPSRSAHEEFFYRDVPTPSKKEIMFAEIMGGFMWWWILWHFYHDYGHVIGEFKYPDPSEWTDEELGIPPDD